MLTIYLPSPTNGLPMPTPPASGASMSPQGPASQARQGLEVTPGWRGLGAYTEVGRWALCQAGVHTMPETLTEPKGAAEHLLSSYSGMATEVLEASMCRQGGCRGKATALQHVCCPFRMEHWSLLRCPQRRGTPSQRHLARCSLGLVQSGRLKGLVKRRLATTEADLRAARS